MQIDATDQLRSLGLSPEESKALIADINQLIIHVDTPAKSWQFISSYLSTSHYPFIFHQLLFSLIYPEWHLHPETAPAYIPSDALIASANISKLMAHLNINEVRAFHQWSTAHYQDFWRLVIAELQIVFAKRPTEICDLSKGVESPVWFKDARLNIVESCFNATPEKTALVYRDENKKICKQSYAELNQLVNRIANSLVQRGYKAGDAIGIAMPMNQYAVAIYLGIIKMGGVVVSIADSFSGQEIATRLRIANAKAIFTQDFSMWAGKIIPLYEKLNNIDIDTIVLSVKPSASLALKNKKPTTILWQEFLVDETEFNTVLRDPMDACNILFSSGTTAEPKAIVWNHTTPIKAASDAFFHQNVKADDVLAWPTNLGWMMGPWLIFAAFINQASIALYTDAPKDQDFGEFVQDAKVSMLGVVPTLVATWRQTHCMEKLNWSHIKVMSSTGECSNSEDMLYLMSLAKYKPIIEYCGGTEIGGAYLSSTVIEPNCPSLFSTPTMGLNICILDENEKQSDVGEVAIIPPSIGLSTELLNAEHYQVYFADMPRTTKNEILRRHGDQIKRFSNGYYSILGRVDDTMNLGGIKTSAAEIERILVGLPDIIEIAAIAISPPDNGPSQLVVYASTSADLEKQSVIKEMQKRINKDLNPLFKIHDVVFTKELPKTASNKIMRRVLRTKYLEGMRN